MQFAEMAFDACAAKAKALNRAMKEIRDDYQVAVILDADNIMSPDFLMQINDAFARGFIAVQGHRVAKNLNTRFAVLDAISEEINNSIFRKGHRALGLSSALIGSGMAFDYAYYKQAMAGVTAHGEDKELEMKILMDRVKIEYLPNALVFDEKVQKAEVFAKQRKRWLSAQLGMFRDYAGTGLKQLVTRGNIDLFDKVVQMMLPPRILHIGIVTLLFLSALLDRVISVRDPWFSLPLFLYGGLWVITLAALLVSIPRKFYNLNTLKALKTLPGAFLIMFSLLFRLKGASKTFIHTPHGTTNPSKLKDQHENRH